MAFDETEDIRRAEVARINAEPGSREALEAKYGEVFDTNQLGARFEVLQFMAPYVVVRERATGVKGSLQFQHSPRLYYAFQEDR